MLEQCNIELGGYIISDGQDKGAGRNIFYLSEIDFDKEKDIIVIGVGVPLQAEICTELQRKGIEEFIFPDKCVYQCLADIKTK